MEGGSRNSSGKGGGVMGGEQQWPAVVHRMCTAIRQSALVDGALLGWALTWGVWARGQGNSSYTLIP